MKVRASFTTLLTVLIVSAVSSGALAGSTATDSAKTKITAKLSRASFTPAQANKVKLTYRFSTLTRSFEYRLFTKKGSRWTKLRSVAKKGSFLGARKQVVKSFFGVRKIAVGRYRLDLIADRGKISKYFRVLKSVLPPPIPAGSEAPPTEPTPSPAPPGPGDVSPLSSPVKLIFIHHSTGQNWLADGNGDLGITLRNNNYFVSDTNYGWDPDDIGSSTDTGHWWLWFRGPSSASYMTALYQENRARSPYSRLGSDPGGENEIVMFKSCYPNSNISGNPTDAATIGENPLRGQGAGSASMTVANVKGIYNDILEYFATRPDKLFVVVVTPPLLNSIRGANARAVANWLVNDWLDGYTQQNVAVFDFYNVLTSNGGDDNTNDLGATGGNHHRWWNNDVQHITSNSNNLLSYSSGDSHPSRAGNQKATAEFVPLLNYYYHRWVNSRS